MANVSTHGYSAASGGSGVYHVTFIIDATSAAPALTAYRAHARAVRCLQAFTRDLVSRMCSHLFHISASILSGRIFLTTFDKNHSTMLTILPLFFNKIGATEIILLIALVLVFFGGKKIPELMRGAGRGIKEFKDAMNTDYSAEKKKEEEGEEEK